MGFEIDFLAVGEGERSGDAIAIRCGNFTGARTEQFVMVIDGGTLESGDALVEHIQRDYGTNRVDLAVNTHPDGDHASGLSRVLEELTVACLWMHRPWLHSPDIKHMFDDGTLSNDRLSAKMRKALEDAWDLERIAKRKGIPITEPFSDGEANRQYQGIYVLGPTEDYYQSLLPGFREMPELKEAIASYLGGGFRSIAKGAVVVVEHVFETWGKETLQDPADDATSSENNSSTIILIRVEGNDLLFTADAGVPALERAVNLAEAWGISLPSCRFQQMPHHGSRRNVGPQLLNRLLGPKLPNQDATNKTVFVSAAKEAPKHPAPKVVNAYMRRGAKVLATQGVGLRHHFNAGSRAGWGPATPLSFSHEVEEDRS
jgi:beta-lactamase superfamily II metal-dependent hydrolase